MKVHELYKIFENLGQRRENLVFRRDINFLEEKGLVHVLSPTEVEKLGYITSHAPSRLKRFGARFSDNYSRQIQMYEKAKNLLGEISHQYNVYTFLTEKGKFLAKIADTKILKEKKIRSFYQLAEHYKQFSKEANKSYIMMLPLAMAWAFPPIADRQRRANAINEWSGTNVANQEYRLAEMLCNIVDPTFKIPYEDSIKSLEKILSPLNLDNIKVERKDVKEPSLIRKGFVLSNSY